MTDASSHFARRLKLRHLSILVAIAKHGSVTRAADTLGISQSALTQTLAEVESIFGSPLFLRSSRGVVPTELGAMALARANRFLQDIEFWEREVQAMNSGYRTHLNLGVVPHVSSDLLTRTVRTLVQRDNLSLTLYRDNTRQLLKLLRERKVDCVIGRLPQDEDFTGLSYRVLYEQLPALVAHPARVKRFANRQVKLEDLRDARWLLPLPDTPTRIRLNEEFRKNGLIPPSPVIETESSEMIEEMIASDERMVSIVPDDVAFDFLRRPRVQTLDLRFEWMLPAIHLISEVREYPLPAEEHLATSLVRSRNEMRASTNAPR
ncbi:LysR family transcriptional regulator [Paraburkholderia sp. ZP32-5]|uniref:LysR family transcriptional regulator n=1 Tax=Paraburkholderia sp. ZP32-5 TaxID=2883245 RepID=UPI001F1C0534|nr:LysR family transcriptional regulator [Paraburkholderia sp. ZP32-5]